MNVTVETISCSSYEEDKASNTKQWVLMSANNQAMAISVNRTVLFVKSKNQSTRQHKSLSLVVKQLFICKIQRQKQFAWLIIKGHFPGNRHN